MGLLHPGRGVSDHGMSLLNPPRSRPRDSGGASGARAAPRRPNIHVTKFSSPSEEPMTTRALPPQPKRLSKALRTWAAGAACLLATTAWAAAPQFTAVDLTDTTVGQDLWQYEYTLTGPLPLFNAMNILFSSADYADLSLVSNVRAHRLGRVADPARRRAVGRWPGARPSTRATGRQLQRQAAGVVHLARHGPARRAAVRAAR